MWRIIYLNNECDKSVVLLCLSNPIWTCAKGLTHLLSWQYLLWKFTSSQLLVAKLLTLGNMTSFQRSQEIPSMNWTYVSNHFWKLCLQCGAEVSFLCIPVLIYRKTELYHQMWFQFLYLHIVKTEDAAVGTYLL